MNQSYIVVLGVHGLIYILLFFLIISGVVQMPLIILVFIFDIVFFAINTIITLLIEYDNEGNIHPLAFYTTYLICIFLFILVLLGQAFSFFKNLPQFFMICKPIILFLLPLFLFLIMLLINHNCIEWNDFFEIEEYLGALLIAMVIYYVVALLFFAVSNFVELFAMIQLLQGFPLLHEMLYYFASFQAEISRILVIPFLFILILCFSYGFAIGN